jgi:hypothetical protein
MSISGVQNRSKMACYGEITAGVFVGSVTRLMAGYGREFYFGSTAVPRMRVVFRDPCIFASACWSVMLFRSGFAGLMGPSY